MSTGGISQLFDRLELSWKCSRWHIHSPDPDYEAKLDYVTGLAKEVVASRGRLVLAYMDEITFYRQPTLSHAWEECGHQQALGERSCESNTRSRVVATLDLMDARVIYRRRSKIGIEELVNLYQHLPTAYPHAERFYIVQDNWPVHYHPDVLVALEKQEKTWPEHRPSNWPDGPKEEAKEKWGKLCLPVQLIRLPTYAPWTNPVEKLWRKLHADVLHLHRMADRLEELRAEVDRFLNQFLNASLDLFIYVGLRKLHTRLNC